ncbi:hypothetical protein ZIOFF_018947 [Zingiber officinale]|uniref:Glycosyltransferase 61 catalytic domain-containing protein n=1 Tax=Zingiber officinale TaxID=94328 RepID=A0A8J5H6X0_ZINOF|nr:hypothetical protein ZIOFF_018947 [Zingiber officinale]
MLQKKRKRTRATRLLPSSATTLLPDVGIRAPAGARRQPSGTPEAAPNSCARHALPQELAVSLRAHPELRPRLLLVALNGTRRFTNVPMIVRAVEAMGFKVVLADMDLGNVGGVAEVVNWCDVIMGVHGTELTNLVFLPTNVVAIQIPPCCNLEGVAEHTYGPQARDSGLLYL